MTVDEILATGKYTDRRGREWNHTTYLNVESWRAKPYGRPEVSPAQMRLLIERDQHRDECRGLRVCYSHPVPHVVTYADTPKASLYRAGEPWWEGSFDSLGEAMDAARALAVGE